VGQLEEGICSDQTSNRCLTIFLSLGSWGDWTVDAYAMDDADGAKKAGRSDDQVEIGTRSACNAWGEAYRIKHASMGGRAALPLVGLGGRKAEKQKREG
jgi:hypothetical protein